VTAGEIQRGRVATVGALPAFQLLLLLCGHTLDHLRGDAEHAHHVLVQHAYPARGNGAHGQLLVAGHPQLAHHKHVQRSRQGSGDLISHGHATPRQAQHHHVRSPGIVAQPFG